MSTSRSICSNRFSRRSLTSARSSTICLLSSLSGRCAAMVSARRPGSSMLEIEVRISGGIFLLSLTYWSNCCITARRSASISLDFGSFSAGSDRRDVGGEMLLAVLDAVDAGALLAFDQHLHGAVGQLEHLQDGGDAADLEHVGDRRLVLGGGFLGHQHDAALRLHGGLERLDALGPAHEQRNDHVREDHHVAQRQQRQVDRVGGQWDVSGHGNPFVQPVEYGPEWGIFNPSAWQCGWQGCIRAKITAGDVPSAAQAFLAASR